MAIPISYNIRNLAVRKTTTLMTAAGIAMTVAVLLAVLGLVSARPRYYHLVDRCGIAEAKVQAWIVC